MRTLKTLTGIIILFFVAIGAVLGALFASGKGPSIRKEFSNQKNFYMNELGEKFSAFIKKFFTRFDTDKNESTRNGEQESAKLNQVELKNATNV